MKKKKLSRKAMRILVVKDAIAQIEAGFIIPKTGSVLCLNSYDSHPRKGAKSILKKFLKEGETCHACARGTLLISTVMRFNKLGSLELEKAEVEGPFREMNITDQRLKELFSPSQIVLMENSFEGYVCKDIIGARNARACEAFHALHSYDPYDSWKECRLRMLAILKNILRNGGRFRPEKERRSHVKES